MQNDFFYQKLEQLFKRSKEIKISDKDNIVIFSDLHLGRGDRNDDFKKNSGLFSYVLKNYYLKNNFKLILNGDIEELQRFSLPDIIAKWHDIYGIFDDFNKSKNLIKIIGNHDYDLISSSINNKYELTDSVRLKYKKNSLFIFHGHQASLYLLKLNSLIGFILKYFANIFGINNYSIPYHNRKRMKIEQRIYSFSKKNRLISVIGHTHRPLFESLSKLDFLKFKIEELCRMYVDSDKNKKIRINIEIEEYKNDLLSIKAKELKNNLQSSLYSSNILLPCLFNSGCCIGKRGITSIEISGGMIMLVQWFDKEKYDKYLKNDKNKYKKLGRSNYCRMIINQSKLDYVFSRIKLLT